MELQKKSWARGRYGNQELSRADEWPKDRKTEAGESGGGAREGPASDPCLLFPRNPELGTEG